MSNDSMKRQQQQDSIDPSSRIDSDLFKDPLKQRESEHEQEWKFRQVFFFLIICFVIAFLIFEKRAIYVISEYSSY